MYRNLKRMGTEDETKKQVPEFEVNILLFDSFSSSTVFDRADFVSMVFLGPIHEQHDR